MTISALANTIDLLRVKSLRDGPVAGEVKICLQDADFKGWMKCDGRLVQQAMYSELYAVIGDKFQVDDTIPYIAPIPGMFRLPNCASKAIIGATAPLNIGQHAARTFPESADPDNKGTPVLSLGNFFVFSG